MNVLKVVFLHSLILYPPYLMFFKIYETFESFRVSNE